MTRGKVPVMDAGNWIALAVAALAFFASILGLLLYITQQDDEIRARIDQERRWREEADQVVSARLTDFRLEAVRTFATAGAIEKIEERLATALDKVTARLETVISRIETLGAELARIAALKS